MKSKNKKRMIKRLKNRRMVQNKRVRRGFQQNPKQISVERKNVKEKNCKKKGKAEEGMIFAKNKISRCAPRGRRTTLIWGSNDKKDGVREEEKVQRCDKMSSRGHPLCAETLNQWWDREWRQQRNLSNHPAHSKWYLSFPSCLRHENLGWGIKSKKLKEKKNQNQKKESVDLRMQFFEYAV